MLGGATPVVEQPAKTKARPSEAVAKPGMYLQPSDVFGVPCDADPVIVPEMIKAGECWRTPNFYVTVHTHLLPKEISLVLK